MSAGSPLIVLEAAGRTYGSGPLAVRALEPTDLHVHAGEFVALMGPSGSGKSTLLHILGCLDRPSQGRYVFGGRDVAGLMDRELAQIRNLSIGFVFQRFHLLRDESAVRNVELPLLYAGIGRAERRRRAAKALGDVGLAPRSHHLPGQLSGGEQQRVALARALVKQPRVLLADEPTGNLDSASGDRVLNLVGEAHRAGAAVFLITHDPRIAERATRSLAIVDGRIFEGPEPGTWAGGPPGR